MEYLESYCLVAEVTFNLENKLSIFLKALGRADWYRSGNAKNSGLQFQLR